MSDLLSLPDIKTIEPPQENETDMMFKVEAVGPPEPIFPHLLRIWRRVIYKPFSTIKSEYPK
ncbi:hypothetical protein ACWOE3_12945 [Enterococcus dispar]|uniref:Uncharacterized protein n=1 Tax=Enterococcus dispar ATCC 51266 TaxID=1139219 RepID=S1NIV4_9ENTE|nr:hypothetical protein [Enterococcus dispar]EOT43680.1 hypothetical protein OMK_00236 [Enterococcus dispar ATCC 51266]EOW85648.1 hypothetical protein I569_00963 [Enterococcus dispar ATCC 51266]